MKIHTARRTHGFTESVIRMMTRLSNEHGAINLSQGFPDFESPDTLKIGAARAIYDDVNQYAITWGAKRYRDALAASYRDWYGLDVDPEAHLTITCGATEAMMAVLLAVVDPGEEVIVFEPFYENYGPDTTLCDATPVFVPLTAEWQIDFDRLRAAFSDRTRAIIVNTPNNPTGRVFRRDELEKIAILCQEFDAYAITDEVYEHILYDGARHIPMATLPGMRDRTITISAASKTFAVTGWRMGTIVAHPELSDAIRKVHDFLTVGAAAPLQEGVATGLEMLPPSYYEGLADVYGAKRDLFYPALIEAGFQCLEPEGAYYVLADFSDLSDLPDDEFAFWLTRTVGVAPVPGSSFFHNPEDGRKLVRFAFCKTEALLEQAAERLVTIRARV
ncbi:aminotransferase class I/II-fold pyridoxal phosphate-dependent enzyme [Candidatus Palauibacter soopunensis]|uniref:pyridoxal phosphate-dependent aminotransferase n=1 Tax=Candidatus Palauibacter soopunensis TaxID=3056739 RepID=UPI0023906674|nr:aminotransferase class I/II-fold pyridoxal phosphate-dependent enzyme [Candidatus Palauibacter soopunensis]MDE2878398.1 aminotransferase class I/II-fold pyridoxal phosphate-dependent enzyme [Candidatus Palauibacter soopunensis]